MSRNVVRMGKLFCLALGSFLAAAGAVAAETVDEEKPHGRVCFSLFEPGPPEKEEPFQICAPGSSWTVRAYVDASEKCTVLVAAITKAGKLADGWRPQLSEVPGDFEKILLPKAAVKWGWGGTSSPFDFYVL